MDDLDNLLDKEYPNHPVPHPGEGVKHDAGKVDLTLVTEYFPRALTAVARVSELGVMKYARGAWRTVPDRIRRYSAALLRHFIDETRTPYDDETDLAQAAQVAWNALARLEAMLEDGIVEDRPGRLQSKA
jgi:hypothetical protein